MKSWKTTVAGVVAVLLQFVAFKWPEFAPAAAKLTTILVGMGLMAARDHDVTSEQAGLKPDNQVGASVTKILGLVVLGLGLAWGLSACATVTGDPVVVNAERALTMGQATFELVVNTDDANREFYKTRLPAFHALAESLRAPTLAKDGTELRRGTALLWDLAKDKEAYQLAKGTNNGASSPRLRQEVMSGTAAVMDLVNAGNGMLATATNTVTNRR